MKTAFLFLFLYLFFSGSAFGSASFDRNLAAAEGGSALAQVKLGNSYQFGKGVSQDYQKAFFWYQKAAEQGYAKGQRPLGVLYEMGLGVDQDFEKAAFWYGKAAEQGLARAQVNLGILYEAGQGVNQDHDKAFYWYEKSAKQGYGRGMNQLGRLYEKGLGRTKDVIKAISWYEKSAAGNYPKAMANLGRIYENGAEGVAVDLEKALSWQKKASAAGYDLVLPAIIRLQKKLSSAKKVAEKEAKEKLIVGQIADKSGIEKKVDSKTSPALSPEVGADLANEEKKSAQTTKPAPASAAGSQEGPQTAVIETEGAVEPVVLVTEKSEIVSQPAIKEADKSTLAQVADLNKTEVGDDVDPRVADKPHSQRQMAGFLVVANIIITWMFWRLFVRNRRKRLGKSFIKAVYKLENEMNEIRRQVEKLQNQT